jgi:hypothetical protein
MQFRFFDASLGISPGRRGVALRTVLCWTLAFAVHVGCSFVMEENSMLLPSSSEYHAYENSWSVNFDNVNAVDFDVLVVEICTQPPCPSQLDRFSGLMDCNSVARMFNDSKWFNSYTSHEASEAVELLCDNMHSSPDQVQINANVIARDAFERPWVTLRQPLSLHIINDIDMLGRWARELNATEEGLNTTRAAFEMVLRVTQVLKLQRIFAYHQSLVRVVVVEPTQSALTFSVQNPCTARGYTAPEFGAVALRDVDQRERCMWTCRVDLLRRPYNSVPPTHEQLNASRPEFAVLDPKYTCQELPRDWVATFFGFEIHTHMIATTEEYTQVLYDALDRMGRAIEKDFKKRGVDVFVALSVHDGIYHPRRFREQLREQAESMCMLTQCENTWFPDKEGWVNQHFVYADARRRGAGAAARAPGMRRRTMSVHTLQVDGVLVSDQLSLLTEDSDRLQVISSLRESVYSTGEMLVLFSSALQISSVEDFDLAGVVGFVSPAALPAPRNPPSSASAWVPNYVLVISSISLIVAGVMLLVCALCVREVLAKRRRRREHYEGVEDGE